MIIQEAVCISSF